MYSETKVIMKRKFKQWCSTIPPISTKRTITSHLSWSHWLQRRSQHMTLEIHVLSWDRHNNMTGLNQLIWSKRYAL